MRNLRVGDRVNIRYFNVSDNRFYGPFYEVTLIEISNSATHYRSDYHYGYKVRHDDGFEIWVRYAEIRSLAHD